MYLFCPQAACRITSEKPIIEGGVLSICSLLVSGSQQPLIEAWQHYMTVDKSREKSQLFKTLTLPRVTAASFHMEKNLNENENFGVWVLPIGDHFHLGRLKIFHRSSPEIHFSIDILLWISSRLQVFHSIRNLAMVNITEFGWLPLQAKQTVSALCQLQPAAYPG